MTAAASKASRSFSRLKNIENYKEIAAQNVGAALRVTGTFILTPEAKQPFELQATEIVVEGASSPEYPLQKKRHTVEYLRTVAHLRPRTNLFNAAFRVRSAAAYAIHKFFNENGFVYVHTPIITGSDCEGAGEMFRSRRWTWRTRRARKTAPSITAGISSPSRPR